MSDNNNDKPGFGDTVDTNVVGTVRVVYRPKDENEAKRRVNRMEALMGTPFIRLPNCSDHKVLMVTSDGYKVRRDTIEMVYNDALLMDAGGGWGEDGPLYRDTIEGRQLEVYNKAVELFAGVEIPSQLRKPV